MSIFLVSCILLSAIALLNCQDIGENCFIDNQGPGVCRLIRDCPEVMSDIKVGKSYTRCGFQGFVPIVCCYVPPTQPPPVTDRILDNERISVKKCYEYSGFSQICRFAAAPFIVGGKPAFAGEFPHMAAIGYDSGGTSQIQWQCGGSLISPGHVLTAGHCVESSTYGPAKFVRVGDLDLNSNEDRSDPEQILVQALIPHPDYHQSSHYNDIAIIILEHAVSINDYKRPACLGDPWIKMPQAATATGWGATDWSGDRSSTLLQVELNIFTQDECTLSYDVSRKLKDGINFETQLCAGSRDKSADSCQGDSGGPLQIAHPHATCMYAIVGVTSFGKACGVAGSPGVYTKVDAFLGWIESVVWPDEV